MASEWFPNGLKALLDGDFNLDTNANLRARLVNDVAEPYAAGATSMSGYTAIGTDHNVTSGDLAITVAGGVVTVDVTVDTTFSFGSPTAGTTCGAFVLYNFDTNDATSTPILWIEFADKATDGNVYEVDINASGLATLTT